MVNTLQKEQSHSDVKTLPVTPLLAPYVCMLFFFVFFFTFISLLCLRLHAILLHLGSFSSLFFNTLILRTVFTLVHHGTSLSVVTVSAAFQHGVTEEKWVFVPTYVWLYRHFFMKPTLMSKSKR